jgi:beta-lactamase superfamily II metal-dependent hydrolase
LINTAPPFQDELEISLFGPGIGECIVAHLGNNEWIIIDSCRNPLSKRPIAIDYLTGLGIDPSQDVKCLVLTHWHNDHIAGSSQIVNICESAKICFSAALLKEEYLTLIKAYTGSFCAGDSKKSFAAEMNNIITILEQRMDNDENYKLSRMEPTVANRIIFEREGNGENIQVRALSPSNASVNSSLLEIQELIPEIASQRLRPISTSQNHNAVAIWINFKGTRVLLGADLEETGDSYTGWSAIVNSDIKPWESGKAKIFKIPHHGSSNAHSNDVWSFLVEPNAACILTTYNGGHSIPTASDVSRIKSLTNNLYATTPPKGRLPKRDKAVERTLKETVKSRKALLGEIGHIQLRKRNSDPIQVRFKGPANTL